MARLALGNEFALIQQDHLIAVFDDASHIVGHHQDGGAVLPDLLHTPVALGLEKHVAHRQGLVHNKDLRLHIDGQGKGQTDEHTAGIRLHRLIHKIADVGKVQDLLELFIHLRLCVPHHGAVHINIFNSRIIHIEAGSQLQKSRDLPVHLDRTGGGGQDAGDDL